MTSAVSDALAQTLFATSDARAVHFIGIAGAGMIGLAELAARRGVTVTGSDSDPTPAESLRALGVTVGAGIDATRVDGARAVVHSSAIPRDHAELARARALGLPIVRRAEALGALVSNGRVIGVSGTHGKTTTTVMTTEALAAAGLAPTGIAGGRVGAWESNVRVGAAPWYVVESDEYDRSFLALTPDVAVVLNVEADHLDIYRDVDEIRDAFTTFASRARAIVLCADDAGARSLPLGPGHDILRYAIAGGIGAADARVVATELATHNGGTRFDVWYDGEHVGTVHLRVPGVHNVRNALAALAAGLACGATVEAMVPGLDAFGGVERRFQRLGVAGGITIIDDYAHHPTEVEATLAAARAAYPGHRVVVAFQPHLYSRTRDFADAFGTALAAADLLWLADLYPAREQPIPGVSSALIAQAARAAGRAPSWEGPRDALATAMAPALRDGDVVLTVGAGDITRTGPELLDLLRDMRA
ncbi:MAG: UDP-N-acetylmuramate--L-alanine ligase [Gemmatimonadaceae bacterium]|jgi:UDP-N-acetylmuramate--alanine ligase|nr:UDP-N-acetylmuramate--L-alanine ligase [Gemmatimonadaceae bacterium]